MEPMGRFSEVDSLVASTEFELTSKVVTDSLRAFESIPTSFELFVGEIATSVRHA